MAYGRWQPCAAAPRGSILAAMYCWWRIWRISSRVRRRRDGRGIARCWRFWRRRWMKKRKQGVAKREALRRESDRVLRDRIRRLLEKPPDERTHFLRKRVGFTASCL